MGSREAEAHPHPRPHPHPHPHPHPRPYLEILATFQSDIVFQFHDNLDHAIGGEFQNFRVDDDTVAIGQGAHFPGISRALARLKEGL